MNKRHLKLVSEVEEESEKHFTTYSVGIVCASVCTDMGVKEATDRLNMEHPTGVGPWFLSEDKTFRNEQPMPCVCERDPTRMHYLFNC